MADITVQEIKKRMDAGEELNLVDVRERDEYAVSHITSFLLPTSELADRMAELKPFRDQELLIHCRSGARSGRVVEYLKSVGFVNPRNVPGGIKAWQREVDPTIEVA